MNPFPSPPALCSDVALRHTVLDGAVRCDFLRTGDVAAQLLLSSGAAPRWVVAFVAGNSGAAVWFDAGGDAVHWRLAGGPHAIEVTDAQGRTLRGIEAEIEADLGCVQVLQALVGSLRVVRDHQFDGRLPPAGLVAPVLAPDAVSWSRNRLDGAAGYALSVQVLGGRVAVDGADRVTLSAPQRAAPMRLRLRACTGETPLTPWREEELLDSTAADLPAARRSLLFLSYREKLLAGSWRFHTYFGRDTLMALRLLMPALREAAIESALSSVLLRLSPAGEVAHEEDIGEFAVLTRLQRGLAPGVADADADAGPIFDYKMVDDDFMLLPVLCAYVVDSAAGRDRARAFLAGDGRGEHREHRVDGVDGVDGTHRDRSARSRGALLARNVAWVLSQARAFADQPGAARLVHLKPGEIVGDWRDSADGLAGGVVSYSTNAVLVPAALRAIEAIVASGLLAPYMAGAQAAAAAEAGAMALLWEQHAPALFNVRVPLATARLAVQACADEMGLQAGPALASLGDSELEFAALSLDAAGRALPVMHSDFSFALLLAHPPPDALERELAHLLRPYPAGLMTGAGMLVANAAHADSGLRALFGADRYHGAVVWSWQQAMAAAGLARQLARTDLPSSTRAMLVLAQAALWQVIHHTRAVADSELWSWAWVDGRFEVRPFGPISASADESNAAQLWSTVYLGVCPPAGLDLPLLQVATASP